MSEQCQWTPSDVEMWTTACGGEFLFGDDYLFCPKCGKRIQLRPPAPPEPVKVEKWMHADNLGNVWFVEHSISRLAAAHVTLLSHPDGRTTLDTSEYERAGAERLAAKVVQKVKAGYGGAWTEVLHDALRDIGASPIAEPDAVPFKALVHKKLDEFGAPAFDGEKCRVWHRLEWLRTRLATAERRGAIDALEKLREGVRDKDRQASYVDSALRVYVNIDRIDAALAELRKGGE